MTISSHMKYITENTQLSAACLFLEESFSKPGKTGQLAVNQIQRAARRVVELLGHQWVLEMQRERDEAVRTFLLFNELKRTLKRSLVTWHKDPARVWRDFEKYALKIASMREAKKILKSYRLQP